jgi:hypothetical protein
MGKLGCSAKKITTYIALKKLSLLKIFNKSLKNIAFSKSLQTIPTSSISILKGHKFSLFNNT